MSGGCEEFIQLILVMVTNTDSIPSWVPTLLAAATIGVYFLIVIGATTTLSNATAACTTWPTCGFDLSNPQLLIAWGHRIAAALIGLVVFGAIVATWRVSAPRRAKLVLAIPFVFYPIQIGIGALAATTTAAWISTAHLVCGAGIFTALVVALSWTLEVETRNIHAPNRASVGTTDALPINLKSGR